MDLGQPLRKAAEPPQPLSPAAMGTNLPHTPDDSAQATVRLSTDLDSRLRPGSAPSSSAFCSPFLSLNLGPAGALMEHSLSPQLEPCNLGFDPDRC